MEADGATGRLDKIEVSVGRLDTHAISAEHRMNNLSAEIKGLGVVVSSQGTKLDEVLRIITANDAAAKVMPRFDFARTLQIVKDLAYLAALIGVLSTWLIITLTAAGNQVSQSKQAFLEQRFDGMIRRMDRLDDRLGWTPNLESSKR